MTTPTPTEAGARALCLEQFSNETIHGDARCCQVGGTEGCCVDALRDQAQACIEAAIATGSLVPAGAVAEMRERCATFLDERADKLRAKAARTTSPSEKHAFNRAVELRQAAYAIRQLDLSPAGGDYAVNNGWRDISTAPKDRFILLFCPEDRSRWLAKWQSEEWYGVDEHGLTRTGHSAGDIRYVTGWFISHWTEVPASPLLNAATGAGVER